MHALLLRISSRLLQLSGRLRLDFRLVEAASEHPAYLVDDVAEVVVDGGDAGEVELGVGHCAGQNLKAHGEQAAGVSGGRVRGGFRVTLVISRVRHWGYDEPHWQERDAGWILTVHRHLDCIDVDCSVHY